MRSRAGLTLVEMLVVVLVVGVLGVVLVPVVGRGRTAARDASCRNNLRQLAQVCTAYAADTGYFPWGYIDPARHESNYPTQGTRTAFPREKPSLHGVKSWTDYESYCWDFTKRTGEKGWRCGEMFRGDNPESVLSCPECRNAQDNWDGNRMTGYNYNVCFLGYVENDSSKRIYPRAWAEVQHPEKIVLFGDGGYAGGPNKFMRAPISDKGFDNSSASLRKAGTQAFRHGSGRTRHCNMSFVDGHVESFTQPYRTAGKPGWVDEASHTAFIAPDNDIYGAIDFN